ncbi:MAG: leucine-rich repeat protein [Clostridia bacterium]|nr:leucine-rich repeat protein [Clostridia bacterium]
MKNHFAQGKASKLRILLILLLLVSLSLLTLSACNKVDVASISVVEDTVPQNVKVSDFDITKVAITVTDSQGNESQIYASSVMLTTDSREKLKEGGEGITINLMYKQKMTSFTVTIFDDNAELVTVTFKDTSGNLIKEIVTIKGGRVTPPTHPVLNGKVADGWVDSNNAAVTLSAIQDSIEVTARYVQNIPIHTVTFKDFNNQTIDTIEVAHGNRIPGAVSYTPPSGSGIETMQWMVGNTPLNTETFIVNNDVIVSMRVEYVTHNVVFQYKNKNNEMIELTSEPVDHNGDAVKANAAKAKLALDGYNFIRWKNSYSNVTMDLTVEAEVAIFSYTVTFKDYNGAILDSGSVNHGDSAAPPASIPTKTGHDFLGEWSGGSLTNITSDMVFVAQYTPKSITLTFFDGASSEIVEKSYGDVITSDNLAELKQKPGNILLGIYSDAALSDVLELPYEVTAPDTIYSKWVDTINGNSELTYSDPDINNKRTVTGYTGSDAIIYIPDKFGGADVTGIDGGIFSGKNVEKVFFGANIKTIGANAFEGTKLSGALQLPSALETIGAGAFADCLFLTSVSIPASVTGIGSSAFFMNEKLAAVTFAAGNALDTIGADVFLGCAALSSITLPASVTTIASGAFTGAGLTSIDLADRVSTIGEHAFAGCENLTAVTGTAALTDIQRLAFASTALVEINLPAVVTIGERAFENNDALTTVALGSTLSALEPLVFANCSALTSVNFSTAIADETVQGITEINNYAFLDCDNLRNIVFPETLSTISALAFENAHKLQSIEVSSENTTLTSVDGVLFSKDMTALIVYPAGKVSEEYTIAEDVTTIKTSAFSGAIIANLTVASTVATLEDDAFNSMSVSVIDFLGAAPNVDKNPLNASLWRLYVATEHLDSFIALSQFAAAQVKPAEYVTSSLYDEVSGLSYVINNGKILIVAADRQKTSITVPASIGGLTVTAIKEYAFANCNNLESVQIDANLLLLGESAFANCTALNDISFASIQRAEAGNGAGSVININAFYDTPWYTSRNLITISDTAFAYKDTFDSEGAPVPVTSLEIPEGVAVLETGLFDNAAAASLTSITLPQSLEIIREGAFRNTNITGISIPNSVHTIGASAFENSKLVSISMNSSAVTDLSAAVFKDCAELQQITLPSSVKTIGAETFMGCVSLTKAVLSSSLVSIGASAFQGCSALPVLDLPARVGVGLTAGALALGNEAFADCDSLVYLRVWNATPATIGTDVFEPYVYIYVESSDGSIADAYRTQWSQYAAQIRDQKDSPVISFTANEDGEGEVIEAMKNLTVASRKAAVLYGDDMSAAFKDAYPGYIFVCWMYEATPSAWLPVEYPFRTSDSTILRARWVKTQEGSLTIDDLTYNSSLNGYVLNTYSGTETRLVIPSVFGEYPLVYIGENAFLGRDGITEIRFAADSNGQYNLKYIGAGAFSEMDGLTSLVLPSSVIDIAENAFAGCTNLESILIPQDVRSIGAYAFEGCAELNIEFAQNSQLRFAEINSFEDTAWYADSKADDQANFVIAGRLILEYLKQENQNLVTLPGNTIALRAQLFANDSDLVTVEFHQYIEFIGERAFYNCASLINVDFGSSDISKINEVGAEAFAGTAWLNQQDEFVLVGTVLVEYKGTKNPGAEKFIVQLPKYITIIDKNAFNSSALDQIIFTADSKLERIEEGAFAYCSNLEKIRIPAGVTFIGKNAFRENTTLQSVVFLGNAVKVIGDTAFYGCTGLGTDIEVPQLTLPSALNALGTGAFEGCSALTNVNLQNTSLTIIKSRTFFGDNNLSTVIIPDTLVTLEADAFAGCTVLENITTGGNSALKVIAAGALETTRWYNREIPEDEEDILIYIGNVLLKYRQKEGSSEKLGVVVPAQVKYIAAYAFINSNISSISLPSGLLEIGDYAFAGCSFLNTVTLPSSVTSIGIYSFSN